MCNYPLSFFEFYDGTSKICPTGTKSIFYKGITYNNPVLVPCGKCIECRLNYSRQWTFRILSEMQYHDKNSFITLTYSNEFVRFSDQNPDHMTLVKSDLQKFFKRLRKKYPASGIMYYAVGEYGSNTFRPHYHMIVFGYLPDDLQFYKLNKFGDPLYTSDELSSLWKFGFNVVTVANSKTAGYCARYVTKKQIGLNAKFCYDDLGIQRPFSLSSKRPAIGLRYFEDHIDDVINYKKLCLPTSDGSFSISPPKYFYDKLRLTNPNEYDNIKLSNRQDSFDISSFGSSYFGSDKYDVPEYLSSVKLSALKRGDF